LAQHKSAAKRARQSVKRRARNRNIRSAVRTGVKAARAASDGDDPAEATAAARNAEGLLRRAASKGVIPKKRASRRVSRLARRANRMSTD
jgi:small subunit ribosomal protein S20